MSMPPNTPQVHWHRISPKHVMREAIGAVIGLLIWIAITVTVALTVGELWWLIPLPFVALSVSSLAFAVLRNRSIRYALRQDDFVVRRGVMFSNLVAVPYGRMQTVSVSRGPIDQMLGLADVKMTTASGAAAVPGLERVEAERLRDHLVQVAETRRAGL